MSESLWYQAPFEFFTRDNFLIFFPTQDMTFVEKLNAIMRFAIYFTIITFLLSGNGRTLFVLLFVAILTACLGEMDKKDGLNRKENFEKNNAGESSQGACIRPTANNPFMNVLMNEYVEDPGRSRACDIDNSKVKNSISQLFDEKIFRDAGDIFHKKASDRQYYTTPNTKIPNDQEGFAKWLYETDPTCKEGNGIQCFSNVFKRTQ